VLSSDNVPVNLDAGRNGSPMLKVTDSCNDLANVYAIIDLASKRGAFQASELQAVGSVANKVKAFVDHIQAQAAAAQEAEAPAEEAAS